MLLLFWRCCLLILLFVLKVELLVPFPVPLTFYSYPVFSIFLISYKTGKKKSKTPELRRCRTLFDYDGCCDDLKSHNRPFGLWTCFFLDIFQHASLLFSQFCFILFFYLCICFCAYESFFSSPPKQMLCYISVKKSTLKVAWYSSCWRT